MYTQRDLPRSLLTVALGLAMLAAAAVTATADPATPHWEISPMAGYAAIDKNMQPDGIDKLKDNLYLGARVGYLLSEHLGLEASGGYVPTEENVSGGEKATIYHYGGDVLFYPFAQKRPGLFLLAGGGGANLHVDTFPTHKTGMFNLGLGIRRWLSETVAFRVDGRDIITGNSGTGTSTFNNVAVAAGLTFALGGKPKDTDGDGVPDNKDKCPNTPAGAKVDANGCPTDADGDGVPDGIDQCPDTPKGAKVDAKGCPIDSDGDGVPDGIDQCPNTPKGAKVDAHGCPTDSDGDGVLDGIDQCPATPKGCTVDEKGCPLDSDGDGVCDGLDKCPDTPAGAKVDLDGCPVELIEHETQLLDTGMLRLGNINFETGKAVLLPESNPVLDGVGQLLSRWPQLKFEIRGHTDSRGSAAMNQKLSDARANSVRDYLLAHFPALKADQLTAKGYGESKPLVPNTSALNMAKNRRVEFVVLNKEQLKQEVEKRKLQQK